MIVSQVHITGQLFKEITIFKLITYGAYDFGQMKHNSRLSQMKVATPTSNPYPTLLSLIKGPLLAGCRYWVSG